MNRRGFIGRSLAYVAGLGMAGLATVGCDTATIAVFVTTITTYAAQLATYFGQASIAGQITALAATIATDIKNWQKGGPVADAIEALTDLSDLVQQIPFAGAYMPFIQLVLGAITGLLALLPSAQTTPVVAAHRAKARASGRIYLTAAPIPYKDFTKKSMTSANDGFVAAWGRLVMTVGPTQK